MNRTLCTAKTAIMLGCCLLGAGFGLVGCQNTAEGVSADASKDTKAVGDAASNAADATKKAADNAALATKDAAGQASDATTLTPKVKAAIIANKTLNDTKNLINVNTKDGVVHLEGHVINNDEKKLAGQVASKAVTESGSKDTVMNQLTVAAH